MEPSLLAALCIMPIWLGCFFDIGQVMWEVVFVGGDFMPFFDQVL